MYAIRSYYAHGQVVDGGGGLAVQGLQHGLVLHLEGLVGGLGQHALDGLLAGGAELGGNDVFGVVEVFVGSDGAFVFLVEQDGLADDSYNFV